MISFYANRMSLICQSKRICILVRYPQLRKGGISRRNELAPFLNDCAGTYISAGMIMVPQAALPEAVLPEAVLPKAVLPESVLHPLL